MRMTLLAVVASSLMACGGKGTEPPPPVVNGSVIFSLDQVECQQYVTAEYWIDSTKVGTEPIVRAALSLNYSVPSGRRVAKGRMLKAGATLGTWTFNSGVMVPANGAVTASLDC
jgi:predicted small lipoprotein YifL